MDLRDYLRVVRKGWPVILALVVLGLAAGVGLTLATSKVYEASVQVFVATSTNASAADLAQGNTFTQNQVQSYTSIATSPSVVDPVITKLRLNLSEGELADKISADAPLNKVLINLHVTDHDPSTAAQLANAVAAQFSQVVQNTEQTDANGTPVVKLTVIHPAQIPSAPIKPNKILNIGLGFVVGLLLGVGIVVLRDVLDNTVKDPRQFEEAGVPAMGIVPFDKRTAQEPIAFRSGATSARAEAYRQIRTNLQFVDVDNPPRIISVTSAMPAEGKSTTALNLAAALAEAGSRVCLIEADLRRPSLAKALGLVGDVGFTTALIGKTPVEDVLQNAGQNLAVLTSGPIPPNPSELLITEHAREIIRRVASHVDFVVIDTPPLLPVTDGATVATLADATLLVARTGRTTQDQAARSVEALDKVGRHPVGVVMNMVTRGRGGYSYEYGYYYTERQAPTKRLASAGVGVGAGNATPDGADRESLDLLGAERGNARDYSPAHAPETPPAAAASGAAPAAATAVEVPPVPAVPEVPDAGAGLPTALDAESIPPAGNGAVDDVSPSMDESPTDSFPIVRADEINGSAGDDSGGYHLDDDPQSAYEPGAYYPAQDTADADDEGYSDLDYPATGEPSATDATLELSLPFQHPGGQDAAAGAWSPPGGPADNGNGAHDSSDEPAYPNGRG